MSQDNQNINPSKDEEVDLIRLFNYFKGGIKSVFNGIGKLIGFLIQFIILLKKNWILILCFILLGGIYAFVSENYLKSEKRNYEMVVRANPFSNLELYAFAQEVNNQKQKDFDSDIESTKLINSLGIKTISVQPVERSADIVNNYFDQIEMATFRGDQTDSIYYKALEIKSHKSKMEKTDYELQRIQVTTTNTSLTPKAIQEKLIDYLNNAPGVKREQEAQLIALTNYEKELKTNIDNIDSLMSARVIANKTSGQAGTEQFMVNTVSRGNLEADLLRYSELYTRKLYSTQKQIAAYQKGVNAVTTLRKTSTDRLIKNPILYYAFLGFVFGALIVLGIQFNKYLNHYQKENL